MSETQVTTEAQIEVTEDLDAFSSDFFGRKPEAEDKPEETKSGAEQETDPSASEDTEAQTDEQDEAELEEEVVEPAPPKKKTVQDRIDEVVRQREELRRESAEQIAKLREELEAFKQSQLPAQTTVEEQEPTPDALDANGDPIYALGEFDPQYIKDLTRFTLDQERTRSQLEAQEVQRAAAAQQEQLALQTAWNDKVTEAVVEYPDFNEKGRALFENFNDLEPTYANYIGTVLMNMDRGPDVLYYLANHPDEAVAIVNSGAQKATLALGRIEARFLQSEIEAPKPKITKAPVPPIARARGTNGAFVTVAPDTDDLDAFATEFFVKKKK